MDLLYHWIAPLVIAFVPAAFRLWRGRTLARSLDDPLFPERLLKARQPMVAIAAATATVLTMVWPNRVYLTIPVLILSNFVASVPLRRSIYDETWSLGACLSFFVRVTLVLWGFWIMLLLAPIVTNHEGRRGWAAAAAVVAIITAWDQRFGDILRRLLRTRLVESPDLLARFAALVERSSVRAPRFDRVPLHGGVVANAMAVPSLRQPGVVFSETLLERLSPSEVAAICAHELAHLEYYNPPRLRRMRVVSMAFIVVAAALAPALRAMGLELTTPVTVGWALTLFAYVVALGVKRQKNETASDLRAIELGGEPEALISALEKLHAYARLPRRWDQQMEQSATHPSLARRVRDIRAAAGAAPLTLGEAATFADTGDGPASVTFHADRLVWSEAEMASFTMPYGGLTELRVDAARKETARLVVADARGRQWQLALAATDIARVQRVLDVVDTRLRPFNAVPAEAPVARLIAALAAVVALFAGQPAAVVALFGFFDTAFPIAALSGMASTIAGLLVWRDGGPRLIGDNAIWPLPVLLLCGAFLLSFAWRSRGGMVSTNGWRLSVMAGVWCGLCLVPIAAASADLVALHQAARSWSGFSILALAFAISTVMRPARWARPAAAAAAAAGVSVLAAGSPAFVDLVVRDPLLLPSPDPRALSLDSATVEADFTINVSPTEVRLSPGGRSLLVIEDLDEDLRQFHVGRVGGPLKVIDADVALFASDDDVIVAMDGDDEAIVRRIPVDAPAAALWEQRIDLAGQPKLSLNGAGTSWRVLGRESSRAGLGIEGSVETGAVSSTARWPMGNTEGSPAAAAGDRLLMTDEQYRPGLFDRYAFAFGGLFGRYDSDTRLWLEGPMGRSTLASSAFAVTCEQQVHGDGAVCTMFDGSRTHVLAVELPSGRIRAVARMPGWFYPTQEGRGWIGGVFDGDPGAVHLASGSIVRIPRARGTFGNIVSGSDERVVATSSNPDEVRVRILRLPRRPDPSAR